MGNRTKGPDGLYKTKDGKKFPLLKGSRAKVWHGVAAETMGGLTKDQLKKNKHGEIVSRAKSEKGAQLLKRLTDKGYYTRKGKFGFVKKEKKGKKTAKRKTGKKKKTNKKKSNKKKK
tara:strand:+ start:23881 stop:24231 length:351 start_codon:yes stop_codon:yes gene_type:complete